MGKNPAFQFYPADWARDMIEHPLEVEGFWIRICCILWWSSPRGTATKPTNIWAKTTAVSPQKCRLLFDYLLKQNIADVEIDNDVYKVTSRRMVRDEHIRNVRSLAGSLGGNPKIKGYPKSVNLVKQNNENQELNLVKQNSTPSSSTSSSTSNNKNKRVRNFFILPDWINKETWESYKEMRQRKRAPLTESASILIVKELEKFRMQGQSPEDVLNQSIMKAWTGVFPISKGGNNGQGSYPDRKDIRGHSVPDEAEKINAEYYAKKAAKEATANTAKRTPDTDDLPDLESI